MRKIKFMSWFFMLIMIACSSDEPLIDVADNCLKMGNIVCNTEHNNSSSRTYYETEDQSNIYCAKWGADDQIALYFNDSDQTRCFKIASGENTPNAIFYGPVPDSYDCLLAVYPYGITKKRYSNSIEIVLPSTVKFNDEKILSNAMPMAAMSNSGVLNFYNLMGVIKISLKGNGLLRNINISSVDGYGLSGNGQITFDENDIPKLSMEENNKDLTVNTGALFLSEDALDLFVPIPATTYEHGLRFDFTFEGGTENRIIGGPICLERSVLRTVRPYEINIPFNFDTYETKDNEIWFKSDDLSITTDLDLGSTVTAQSISKNDGIGVITTESPIIKIGSPIFINPESVTYVKLPNTVQEISSQSFKGTTIEEFVFPNDLKEIGTDAFLGCSNLKKVILNDGFQSIGMGAFEDCLNIEYVYIPESVRVIGCYSFLHSTSNLDHWEGNCPLIDKDHHTLYENNTLGNYDPDPTMIGAVAGCNLTEYHIPEKALRTQNYAFEGLKKLKKLIVHRSFEFFAVGTIEECEELEIIECYATTPPQFPQFDTWDGYFIMDKIKEVRVPKESIEKYKKANGWKSFSNKIIAL